MVGHARLLLLLCLAGSSLSLLIPRRLFLGGTAPTNPGYSYETKTFQQQVDHFNFQNTDVFNQIYLVNDSWWEKGGPIFFYTGNEGEITWFCNNTGFMWDIAAEFKAMLVFSEHRYYGSSLPFGEKSFTNENIVYLTVEQALADHAMLIDHIKSGVHGAENSSVIAFGGSYGGMLAAWIRMKYPNLVDGSIAASAPIWQFGDLTPCEMPYKILTRSFTKAGELCPLAIRMSWDALKEMGESNADREWLHKTFNLCGEVDKGIADDLSDWLQAVWFNMGMANYPYPASFLEPLPAWPVKEACKYLSTKIFQSHRELLMAISDAATVYYNYEGQANCLNTSQTALASLQYMPWNFQACTEMVMPQCSTGIDDMYPRQPWDIHEYTQFCKKLTGMSVNPDPNWLITQFGGKDITSYSNILFSNGELDPWSGGGVLRTLTSGLPAVIIPNGAHHLDMRAHNPDDPEDVQQARMKERDFIKSLI